ncbi:hypothetical protein Taro_039054 [Colocasia esculenta]|uniref:Uncharacterized protein n=1 Tax=Colocasia esculenta TaxID=4460 RepID=A0A843W598_COLES|nr:hypothetical protein [Colocasia esculenta]
MKILRSRQTPVRVATGQGQNATGLCEEHDRAVRSGSRVATERFVAFRTRRSVLSRQELRMRPIGSSPSQGLCLTSTEKGHVAADEKGKKERLGVGVPQLLSHQELLHTPLARSKTRP